MTLNEPSPGASRCLLGFFGMDRSLRWTARSIRRNIIRPLEAAGFDCFLAAHFNRPAVIDHPSSGERGMTLPRGGQMTFDFHWFEPQSDDNIADLIPNVLAAPFRDYEDPTGGTRRNILHQMHSLRRLRQMIELAGWEHFDAFLFLRPDIEYIDPIEVDAVRAVVRGETDIVTPSWHQWGGLNDRFAFCNRAAAEAFLGRRERVASFCEAHGYIHPETLLAEAISSKGLRIRTTEQRALRVRATGETRAEGFHLGKIMRATHRARPLLAALLRT